MEGIMRPIKFRGIVKNDELRNGDTVYGGCCQYSHNGEFTTYIIDDEGSEYEVDAVAQLVGYDIDGAEVYEGDTLVRDDVIFIAALVDLGVGTYTLKGDD